VEKDQRKRFLLHLEFKEKKSEKKKKSKDFIK